MHKWLEDWRFLTLVYIICAGLWGVLAKFASSRLNWATTNFVIVIGVSLVVVAATFRGLRWQSRIGVLMAATSGVLAGVGSLAFYAALRDERASVVVPLSSLSLVLTVVLSYLFLGETINLRQLLGIILGLAAIALLAR